MNFSLNPQSEGFESHPSSLVITKEMSEALRTNLHMELSEQTPSPRPDERDETHDPPVTPPDSHMTNSEPSDTAISHLTNDILTYSSQVAMTAPDITASVSQSTWLPSSRDILRPTSPMAVNRVFKVVFLGKYMTLYTWCTICIPGVLYVHDIVYLVYYMRVENTTMQYGQSRQCLKSKHWSCLRQDSEPWSPPGFYADPTRQFCSCSMDLQCAQCHFVCKRLRGVTLSSFSLRGVTLSSFSLRGVTLSSFSPCRR